MSYTIKSNTPMINFSIDRAASLAVRNMLQDTHREAQPNTPRDIGDLKDNVIIQVLGTTGTIRWTTPYAAYQERGKRKDGTHVVKNYTSPGTGKDYAKNAVKAVTAKSGKYFNDALKLTAQPKVGNL